MSHFSSHFLRAFCHRARWHVLALLLFVLGLARPQAGQAQALKAEAAPSFFQPDAATAARGSAGGTAGRALLLDTTALRALLRQVPPMGASARGGGGPGVLMALPLPDGSTGRFRIYESSVMAPELAARYPQIKTYSGVGVDDPTASIALDMTPLGFHAQVLSNVSGTSYIDPMGDAAALHYRCITRQDMPNSKLSCGVVASRGTSGTASLSNKGVALRYGSNGSSTDMMTLRLALACAPGYSALFGNNVTNILAAVNTSITRVNGIYERELGVHLVLVQNTGTLFFTPTNAPQTAYNENSFIQCLDANMFNLKALVPVADYDIGHVFVGPSTGGLAGLATPEVVFKNTYGLYGNAQAGKARGVSGLSAGYSTGDMHDVRVVAHEMGHQMGAQHVFNGTAGSCSGNRNSPTAVEPGSGSTIMSYGGNCGTDNYNPVIPKPGQLTVNLTTATRLYLEQFIDDYFNTVSYEQIQETLYANAGITSATTRANAVASGRLVTAGNRPTALTQSVKTQARNLIFIPKQTPFKLTLAAPLQTGVTYCWEESDTGVEKNLPTMPTQRDGDRYPLFRSQKPTASADRYFPSIENILRAKQAQGTLAYPEETLPRATRSLNFTCTARNLTNATTNATTYTPAGTYSVGGVRTVTDIVQAISTAGPFQVTTTGKVHVNKAQTRVYLTWDIANTTATTHGSVNCQALMLSNVERAPNGTYTVTPDAAYANFQNNGSLVLDDTYFGKTLMVSALADNNFFFDIGFPDKDVTGGKPTAAKIASIFGFKNLANSLTASLFSSTVNLSSPTGTGAAGIAAQTNAWSATQRATGVYSFQYGGDANATLDISKVLNDEGTGIRTAAYDPGSALQQFLLQDVGDGRFRIFAGDDSGRLLEAYTPAGSSTQAVRLVPYVDLASATDGQKWDLTPIYDDFVTGQAYNLQPANGRNLALSGTAVQLTTQNDNTATAQQWTVNEPATGFYTFTSVTATTKLLTVTSGALTTATANAAATLPAANTQYFKLVPSTPGYYKVLNVVSNQYLQQSTAATSGLALTPTATAAGTDWRFNDVLIPTLAITIANPSNSSTVKYVAPTSGSSGSAAALSATSTGWTVGKVAVAGAAAAAVGVFAGPAIVAAVAGTSTVALLELTSAVVIAVSTASNIGVGLCLETSFVSPRRTLLATEDGGTMEETHRLGLLANGKYLIFDYHGDHVMTLQADGSIVEADYTGAANQQWDLAPTAPLTTTLYSPGVVYGEYSQSFGIGDYSTLIGSTVGNDAVTRLEVPAGLEVTLYQDVNFAGNSWSFRTNATSAQLGGAARLASSVRVRAIQEVLQAGGLYRIVSRSAEGNQVLQAPSTALNSSVTVAAYTGSASQLWSVSKTAAYGAGTPLWKFIPQNNTSSWLYVSPNGTPVATDQLKVGSNATNPLFQLARTTDGFFHINIDNGLYNNLYSVPCFQTMGTGQVAQVMANTGTGNPEQEWRFERVNPAATVYEMASTTYTGGGYALPLASGRYTSAQLSALGISANSISALKLSPDYEIIFFADDNFVGESWRYQADVTDLANVGGDNTVESIIVRPSTDELVDGQTYTITNASTGTLLQASGARASSRVTVSTSTQDQVMPNQRWTAKKAGTNWAFSPQNAPLQSLANDGIRADMPYIHGTNTALNAQQYQLTPIPNGNFQLYTALGKHSLEARITGNVLLADPTPASLSQQWRFDVVAPVTVYAGASYVGAIPLTAGLYSQADLRNLGMPLASSGALQPGSVRVTDGYEVVLYSGDAGTGTGLGDYFADQPMVYTTCSSLLVRLAPVVANMYSSDAFGGTDVPLSQGHYTSAELLARGLDANDISSLKVPDGYEAILFDQNNFTGSLWNYRADHSNLRQDEHGHYANDVVESVIVRPTVLPVSGATYWIQPVQTPSLALGSGTGVTNGTVAATTFNYALSAQQWVVEVDLQGLWSLRQPGGNYLDAPDRNAGTALTYGSPGFFPQAFHLVNMQDNIWRIMGRDGLVSATLNADNTIGLAAPLAFDAPTQNWYFSRVGTGTSALAHYPGSAKAMQPAVTLFPNPATATITLQDLPAGATVTVLDLMGKTVLTSTKAVISIAGLPAGVYIAVVGQQHVRFIKQ